jgi:hypothetical protein
LRLFRELAAASAWLSCATRTKRFPRGAPFRCAIEIEIAPFNAEARVAENPMFAAVTVMKAGSHAAPAWPNGAEVRAAPCVTPDARLRHDCVTTDDLVPSRTTAMRPSALCDGTGARGARRRFRADGRYWARTSDLQLVELALSQLS